MAKIEAERSTPRQLWHSIDTLMGRQHAPMYVAITADKMHSFLDLKVADVHPVHQWRCRHCSSTAWQIVQLRPAANSPAQGQYRRAGTVPCQVIQSFAETWRCTNGFQVILHHATAEEGRPRSRRRQVLSICWYCRSCWSVSLLSSLLTTSSRRSCCPGFRVPTELTTRQIYWLIDCFTAHQHRKAIKCKM